MFCLCMSVISSFKSLGAGSQVFAHLMLFFLYDFAYYVVVLEPAVDMHLSICYSVIVCHQNYVCKHYIGSVYVGLIESGNFVFRKVCPVGFLQVSKCSHVLL